MSIRATFRCGRWPRCLREALRKDIHVQVIYLEVKPTRIWRRGLMQQRRPWKSNIDGVRCQLEALTTQSLTTSICSLTIIPSHKLTSSQLKTQEQEPELKQQQSAPKTPSLSTKTAPWATSWVLKPSKTSSQSSCLLTLQMAKKQTGECASTTMKGTSS